MTEIIEQIQDAIYALERDAIPHDDWPVYVPHDKAKEIHNHISARSHQEVYNKGAEVMGKRVIPDSGIDEPVVLPESPRDMPRHMDACETPPNHLLNQLIDIHLERREPAAPWKDTTTFSARLFFRVKARHKRYKHDKLSRFNLGIEADTDEQTDELERVKFGMQMTHASSMEHPVEWVQDSMRDGVRETINSVQRKQLFKTRTRTIKGPYPVLDQTITEQIPVGTKYTYYGGVYLPPLKMDVGTMEPPKSRV